jgi:hypothetical protein
MGLQPVVICEIKINAHEMIPRQGRKSESYAENLNNKFFIQHPPDLWEEKVMNE